MEDIFKHLIKGLIAQHQERYCKSDLSITFTIPQWLSIRNFNFREGTQ